MAEFKEREQYYADLKGGWETSLVEEPTEDHPANLVSSKLTYFDDNFHSPVLDIDFPAQLIPSTTEGHFHLYLDGLEMSWDKYKALLIALGEAGVIGQGYLSHALERGMTTVRLPGLKKTSDEYFKSDEEEPW